MMKKMLTLQNKAAKGKGMPVLKQIRDKALAYPVIGIRAMH
jgi:hypothetical protein